MRSARCGLCGRASGRSSTRTPRVAASAWKTTASGRDDDAASGAGHPPAEVDVVAKEREPLVEAARAGPRRQRRTSMPALLTASTCTMPSCWPWSYSPTLETGLAVAGAGDRDSDLEQPAGSRPGPDPTADDADAAGPTRPISSSCSSARGPVRSRRAAATTSRTSADASAAAVGGGPDPAATASPNPSDAASVRRRVGPRTSARARARTRPSNRCRPRPAVGEPGARLERLEQLRKPAGAVVSDDHRGDPSRRDDRGDPPGCEVNPARWSEVDGEAETLRVGRSRRDAARARARPTLAARPQGSAAPSRRLAG